MTLSVLSSEPVRVVSVVARTSRLPRHSSQHRFVTSSVPSSSSHQGIAAAIEIT